jgi:DNA repair ATPase RecN
LGIVICGVVLDEVDLKLLGRIALAVGSGLGGLSRSCWL